jgi:hypothetical protein
MAQAQKTLPDRITAQNKFADYLGFPAAAISPYEARNASASRAPSTAWQFVQEALSGAGNIAFIASIQFFDLLDSGMCFLRQAHAQDHLKHTSSPGI